MDRIHREACDACHSRKVRCSSATGDPGACWNCQRHGRKCVFSPRKEMGRPRKSRPVQSRAGTERAVPGPSSPRMMDQEECDDLSLIDLPPTKPQGPPAQIPASDPLRSFPVPYPLQLGEIPLPPSDVDIRSIIHLDDNHLLEDAKEEMELPLEADSLWIFDCLRTVAAPVRTPRRGSPSPVPPGPDPGPAFYESISFVLFSINRVRQVMKQDRFDIESQMERLFSTVSGLCDIVQPMGLDGGGPPDDRRGVSQGPITLALTAVSIVLEIYEMLIGHLDDTNPVARQLQTNSHSSAVPASRSLSSPLITGTQGRSSAANSTGKLDFLLRQTVMHFHLTQLRPFLDRVSRSSGDSQPVLCKAGLAGDIDPIRKRLDGLQSWLQFSITQAS